MSVKDDLLADFPEVHPGLTRDEVERLLTLLDQSASTEGAMSLSIATALKPLVPGISSRIESYNQSGDADDYLRILRGAVVLLVQKWQPDGESPTQQSISDEIDALEAVD